MKRQIFLANAHRQTYTVFCIVAGVLILLGALPDVHGHYSIPTIATVLACFGAGILALRRYRLAIEGERIIFDSPFAGHHEIPIADVISEQFAAGYKVPSETRRPFVRYEIEYRTGSDRRTLSIPWKIFQMEKIIEFNHTLHTLLKQK